MSLKFKKGDTVRQVVPVIQGVVTGQQIIDDQVHYAVEWTDGDGVRQERIFAESQIEAAPDA